ncbi:MAG: zinc-binding dehydrogenase [Dehalococcoidia bacterium]|nr:zinc-binding dehydrogenase [Dehalococcoidia bacterium]
MTSTRVARVSSPKGPFEVIDRELDDPGPNEVRVAIHASGICHTDSLIKEGTMPGGTFPTIPGHEVAGVIDAIGLGVVGWHAGQRVGVGWFGGSCKACEACRRGDFINCSGLRAPGVDFDGGYADHMLAHVDALALIPEAISCAEAAPLLCAGVTTFGGLRASGARAGDRVAVHGVGGLGHLGVQFAARMGCETVAIARGRQKEQLARELGAHHYIDSEAEDFAEALLRLGGADVILSTVTDARAMSASFRGLAPRGRLMVLGLTSQAITVSPGRLIVSNRSIIGYVSGTAMDSQDTLNFSALTGVRPIIETMPLERINEGYERMMSGDARFRVVLTPSE